MRWGAANLGISLSTNHTVPYGRGFLGWRCSRHFVPGCDRTVPPGHFAKKKDSLRIYPLMAFKAVFITVWVRSALLEECVQSK